MLNLMSLHWFRTYWIWLPDTSPSTTTQNRRSCETLSAAAKKLVCDLQLLGGREVRHHKRLLHTQDGQPRPRAILQTVALRTPPRTTRHRTEDPVRRSDPRRQSSSPSRGRSPTAGRKRGATSQTTHETLDVQTPCRPGAHHGTPWQSASFVHAGLSASGPQPSLQLG